MKVQSIFVAALMALVLFGCSGRDKAVVRFSIPDAPNSKVALYLLNVNKLELVDTLKTNSKGDVVAKVKLLDESPNFYYLYYNGKRIANLLLSPKESLEVSCDTLGQRLIVAGSDEAELYAKILEGIEQAQSKFDSLTVELLNYEDLGDETNAQRLRRELGKLYVKEKQSSIVKIVTNPYSFTNITLLYREFNENFPLFGELTDGIYFKQVGDSLKRLYPDSPYVRALLKESSDFGNNMELRERIKKAGEVTYPELSMVDVNSNTRNLSSLLGRPFVLLFWSAQEKSHKMLNAELESIYKRHSSRGLEIYSVCVDTDKTYWAQIVKRYPWINVCDGMGAQSPALRSYNVSSIPAMYIFDRNGEIVARDVFELKDMEQILAKL